LLGHLTELVSALLEDADTLRHLLDGVTERRKLGVAYEADIDLAWV
jgi:hypothetical protein